MQTLNFKEVSTELAHLSENFSSIILKIKFPNHYTFSKHLDFPTIESVEKDVCVVQKILRDNESPNFKLKLNNKVGRSELKLAGKVMLFDKNDSYIVSYLVIVPVLVSNAGKENLEIETQLA